MEFDVEGKDVEQHVCRCPCRGQGDNEHVASGKIRREIVRQINDFRLLAKRNKHLESRCLINDNVKRRTRWPGPREYKVIDVKQAGQAYGSVKIMNEKYKKHGATYTEETVTKHRLHGYGNQNAS